MRIRKRPSSAPQKQRLIQQLPATYKYVFSTGWLLKRAFEEHDKQHSTGLLGARYSSSRAEERGLPVHGGLEEQGRQAGQRCHRYGHGVVNTSVHCCSCDKSSGLNGECKQPEQQQQPQYPIGEEVLGEEPRTPPPVCGEKPALARQRSEHQLPTRHPSPLVEEKCRRDGERLCYCRNDQQPQMKRKTRRKQLPDLVKGESSSGSGRKRTRTRVPSASGDEHGRASSRLRDTAESSERSSQENCGPQLRLNAAGGASLGESYLRELSKMDPLRRALHTVVSEAGIVGLTAREAAEKISRRRLLSEADIPRSVKMAKVMRDSPYLLELSRDSKFVLWSTFLEDSSRKANSLASGRADRAPSTTGVVKTRTRRVVPPAAAAAAVATTASASAAAVTAAALLTSLRDGLGSNQGGDSMSFGDHRESDAATDERSTVVRREIQCPGLVTSYPDGIDRNLSREKVGSGSEKTAPAVAPVAAPVAPLPVRKWKFFDLNLAPQEQEEM